MKKILLLFLLGCVGVYAQRKYVITPTLAYNDEKGSKAVGIFLRGAVLNSYEYIEDRYAYKVKTPYSGTVYIINNYNVKDALNANDNYEKSPAVVVEADEYYGSPHLFTTVAGLKVRELPNAKAKSIGTLLNGTPVAITYYPYDTEGWIEVYVDNKLGYIPIKYVGKRPILTELISNYKKAETFDEQKKFAERILELGWNSAPKETETALKLYADFAAKNNLLDVAEISLLQADVIKAYPTDDFSKIDELKKINQLGFTLNNKFEPEKGFSKVFLEANLGRITNSYTDLDDCTLGDYETNVFFNSVECIGHDINKTYHIRSMEMVNTNGFILNKKHFTQQTTLVDFLKAAKGFISYINAANNTYYISNDSVSYEFRFVNNKLHKVSMLYYC